MTTVNISSGDRISRQLAGRVARSLPGASFELETLVRLAGVEASEEIDTAAVTCGGRARLLLNPSFVETHCQRDEHLFLLVMHEMWHVLLGHTTLYGRPTRAHNIAFDALINAGLTRQHPQPEYRGLFESLNSPHLFPQLLLRAPEGWPNRPRYKVAGPAGTADILKRLYPPKGVRVPEPTYDEILRLLREGGMSGGAWQPPGASQGGSGGTGADGEPDDGATLLGDHSHDGSVNPLDDEAFADVVRRIVGSWPPPPIPLRGRDAGGQLRTGWTDRRPSWQSSRNALTRILKEVTRPDPTGRRDAGTQYEHTTVGPGPLPNATDRTLPARRALLGANVLPNQRIILPRRHTTPPSRALVYLDVSGSMGQILPNLVDLLAGPAARREIAVRQFSTEVTGLTVQDLAAGRISTTGGTDIGCVLDDLAGRPERRVLIVTDGYVGEPSGSSWDKLLERGIELHAALPADGWEHDLAGHARIHHIPGVTYEEGL